VAPVRHASVAERHASLKEMHKEGFPIVDIAKALSVNVRTIYRDCKVLGLGTFSSVSDAALLRHVCDCTRLLHGGVGMRKIEGYLQGKCGRVQERRIRWAMMTLYGPNPRPVRLKRRPFYASRGPDFVWCLDQNEKLGKYGFKFLAAICGFSRFPVHFEMCHELSGRTHSRFFSNCLAAAGKAPVVVSVDGARQWNGVKEQVRAIHGDPDRFEVLDFGGSVRSQSLSFVGESLH